MQRKGMIELTRGKIIAGAVFIAVVTGAVIFYLFYTGSFGGGSKIKIDDPVRVGYDWRNYAAENNIVSDYLFSRSKKLIVAEGGDGVLAATSYTIAGRLVTEEAESSGIYGLSDQALLMKCYVRAGDKMSATSLRNKVNELFRLPDGSYRAFVYADGTNDEMTTNASMIDWLDAMCEYYVNFGNDDDYDNIKRLTEAIFDSDGSMRTEKISVAKYAESLYVGLDDTSEINEDDEATLEQIYGTITGELDGAEVENVTNEEEVEGVLLSNINLRLIRDLEANGLLVQGAYDKALLAVKKGFAGDGNPFYAYATFGAMDGGEYYFCGRSTGAFDIAQNIKTMRNLAEVGELDSFSYGEFKGQIMNSGRIYSEYNIMSGNYSGSEATGSYVDGLMIAFYMQDANLYSTLTNTIGKRVATKSSSPALYMVFREENDRYVFYARENMGVRLATF